MSQNSARVPEKGYKKLLAFKEAHALVKATYAATNGFPKTERFGLIPQMRRAAVSVAANIVEGYCLNTTALFLRHLRISFGSCKELEYYLELAWELQYVSDLDYEALQDLEYRVAYLIGALIRSLKQKADPVVREEQCCYETMGESPISYHSSHSSHSELLP